ncbi:unnamed protein product, partial [Durusdinium trenchii]
MRRVLTDAQQRFDAADLNHLHHLGFIDVTKYGRLSAVEIQEICTWCHQLLSQNPEFSMVFMTCPVIASDSVLNGLRGEYRRIEDKLNQMQMEAKVVQVMFDTGTLFKAPRNSERKVTDDNIWTKSDYWNLLVCPPSVPLPVSEYVTPESGTFFTHEQGRSLTDKQEGAQWFAAPAAIHNIISTCLSRVSSLKGQALIVQHLTTYDGVMEKVLLDIMNELSGECYVAGFSETQNPNIFQYAVTGVKDKLLGEWKTSKGLIGQMAPKFQETADLSDQMAPRMPQLKLCRMTEEGSLSIPNEAQEFISKPANEGKAIEFRVASGEDMVVLEEQSTQGPADSAPMSFFQLVLSMERKGILDCKLTGHTVDRPAAVKRGEERDRIEISHESYSVFKPNSVSAKQAKATNIAGLLGFKALNTSNHLQL